MKQDGASSSAAPTEAGGRHGPVCCRLVPWLLRRRRPVLWAALALSLAGTWCSALLYSDLRSDVEELLPESALSVVAARTVSPKLHSLIHLSVVLEGDDAEGLERLADDLAARLRALPGGLVESVEYRTDAEETFLRRFGGFYLASADLRSIQERVDRRLAWERRKANPLLDIVGEDEAGPPPPLDFSDIESRYEAGGGLSRFRKGYFQTPDGRLLVLLVRPPEDSTGYAANRALLDAVKGQIATLHPERYDPAVRVGFDGEVASLVDEQEALVGDLASSTVVVLTLVLLVLWTFFRRWTAILAVFGALAAGCAITFGLSWFLVGHLNANTAFLGSIVVGNGINVSIIFVARFLEERGREVPLEEAMMRSWTATLAATFVASFGAGLAYLSLASTDFRGFSQFGVIGGLGMALCWVTAFLLLPPLLAVLDSGSRRATVPGRRSIVGRAARWVNSRHPRAVRAFTGTTLLLAVAGVVVSGLPLVEYDLSRLRSQKSLRSGSQHWAKKVDQVFRAWLTPTVLYGETPEELEKALAALDEERRALGEADPLREVRTLRSALPPNQAEKVPLLEKLRDTLTDGRVDRLDPELRQKVRALRPPRDVRPVTFQDLPASLRLPLTERDGAVGRIALLYPKKVGTLSPLELHQFASLIREAIGRSGARAQAVGQSLLFEDVSTAILRDGPRATILALGSVCLLVFATLRRLGPSVQVLGSLLVGVAWLLGAAAAAQVRINFLNFVVLPITFGIGVDYAVNIVQRWRLEGPGSLPRVLEQTGGAVALCSATTIIGYASLLAADNRALRGFGLLASLGEVTCVTAALLAMPAWSSRARNNDEPAKTPPAEGEQ